MTPAVLVAVLFLFVLGNPTQKATRHVLVADPYYWTGPEGNLGIEITGKFQSEEGLKGTLNLSNEIGLFKDRKYPFKLKSWRLRDILISVDLNSVGSVVRWQVSGPKPLLLGYLDRLKKDYDDKSVFYDLSYRFIVFKPSTD